MADQLAWGVMGTGNIARQFAAGVNGAPRSVLAAVGSRSLASAQAFAAEYDIPNAHESYDRLLQDDQVQAIYVSLPNTMHAKWTIKALEAGKHVLCEKPLAVSREEAQRMFDAADAVKRVLVEAFMYRCTPLMQKVKQLVDAGAIGPVRMIRANFCYRTRKIDGNIRFDPTLAGGSAMDVGCYCIDFARWITGSHIESLHAVGHIHDQGVDDAAAGVMKMRDGTLVTWTSGMSVQVDNTAYIAGEEGYLEIPIPWKPPTEAAIVRVKQSTPPRQDQQAQAPAPGMARSSESSPGTPPGNDASRDASSRVLEPQEIRIDSPAPLYGLEADAFAAAVLDGTMPSVTRDDSLANMAALDQIRRQIGLKY